VGKDCFFGQLVLDCLNRSESAMMKSLVVKKFFKEDNFFGKFA
jgi:hypothetical protein